MSARRGSSPEDAEAIVEPLRDRRRTEHSQPAGGELERQRQAIEAQANAGDVGRILIVDGKTRSRRRRSLGEQPHGLVAEELARLERPLGIRDVQRGNSEHDLARHVQRLPAGRENRQLGRRPKDSVRDPGRRAEEMLAVV